MIQQYKRLWMPLMAILMVFQLTACGDKDAENRKAFTDFLQNTVMRGDGQVPTLSEDQRRKFGLYVSDYAILAAFSQKMQKSVDSGLIPIMTLISQIRVPEDYILKRDMLEQSLGALSLLGQQVQSDKVQADRAHAALKQPDDVKVIYEQAYNKIVTQPANELLPLLPQLTSLAQSIIQAGDFLREQGTRATYTNGGVQLSSQQAVDQYNSMMKLIQVKQQAVQSIHTNLLY